ncbi:hypothetical protein FGO68_gene6247 [Halteria grandinella]|uniref:Uncharacterized protein n=1 Tax=Halteria grandinella TaxID=5974 RepID=A0A8J8NZU7_HALGN|nr:hypothetical protein FGO68_gene6247 [Halteria grandinella]
MQPTFQRKSSQRLQQIQLKRQQQLPMGYLDEGDHQNLQNSFYQGSSLQNFGADMSGSGLRQGSVIQQARRLDQSGSSNVHGSGVKRGLKAHEKLAERNQALLREYNDMRTHEEEARDIGNKLVYTRRISLELVKHREDLYPFPILHFVEDTAKIAMMRELELAYWYHLMKTYLKKLDGDQRFTIDSVRLFFFNTAVFTKRFLLQRQLISPLQRSHPLSLAKRKLEIDGIEVYIKTYHVYNFEKLYQIFDRSDNQYLLDESYKQPQGPSLSDPPRTLYERDLQLLTEQQRAMLEYEGKCYLAGFKPPKINAIFKKLKRPLESDEKLSVINYDWQVDNILKNSQSYNKEPDLAQASIVASKRPDMRVASNGNGKGRKALTKIMSFNDEDFRNQNQGAPIPAQKNIPKVIQGKVFGIQQEKGDLKALRIDNKKKSLKRLPPPTSDALGIQADRISQILEASTAPPAQPVTSASTNGDALKISPNPVRVNELTVNESTMNLTPQFTPQSSKPTQCLPSMSTSLERAGLANNYLTSQEQLTPQLQSSLSAMMNSTYPFNQILQSYSTTSNNQIFDQQSRSPLFGGMGANNMQYNDYFLGIQGGCSTGQGVSGNNGGLLYHLGLPPQNQQSPGINGSNVGLYPQGLFTQFKDAQFPPADEAADKRGKYYGPVTPEATAFGQTKNAQSQNNLSGKNPFQNYTNIGGSKTAGINQSMLAIQNYSIPFSDNVQNQQTKEGGQQYVNQPQNFGTYSSQAQRNTIKQENGGQQVDMNMFPTNIPQVGLDRSPSISQFLTIKSNNNTPQVSQKTFQPILKQEEATPTLGAAHALALGSPVSSSADNGNNQPSFWVIHTADGVDESGVTSRSRLESLQIHKVESQSSPKGDQANKFDPQQIFFENEMMKEGKSFKRE